MCAYCERRVTQACEEIAREKAESQENVKRWPTDTFLQRRRAELAARQAVKIMHNESGEALMHPLLWMTLGGFAIIWTFLWITNNWHRWYYDAVWWSNCVKDFIACSIN